MIQMGLIEKDEGGSFSRSCRRPSCCAWSAASWARGCRRGRTRGASGRRPHPGAGVRASGTPPTTCPCAACPWGAHGKMGNIVRIFRVSDMWMVDEVQSAAQANYWESMANGHRRDGAQASGPECTAPWSHAGTTAYKGAEVHAVAHGMNAWHAPTRSTSACWSTRCWGSSRGRRP